MKFKEFKEKNLNIVDIQPNHLFLFYFIVAI